MTDNDIKNLLWGVLIGGIFLIVIYWFGQAAAWQKTRQDVQRKICVQETHDGYFCNVEW